MFKNKTEAKRFFSALLKSHGVGDVVTCPELRWLLTLHPDAQRKVGVGVRDFVVYRNKDKTVGFAVVRVDGSTEDFSFHKCLASKEQLLSMVCREVVKNDVWAWVDAQPKVVCSLTGKILTRAEAHVHHSGKTFLSIVREFAASHVVEWDGSRLSKRDEQSFRRFHADRARLQFVEARAHLGLKRNTE